MSFFILQNGHNIVEACIFLLPYKDCLLFAQLLNRVFKVTLIPIIDIFHFLLNACRNVLGKPIFYELTILFKLYMLMVRYGMYKIFILARFYSKIAPERLTTGSSMA